MTAKVVFFVGVCLIATAVLLTLVAGAEAFTGQTMTKTGLLWIVVGFASIGFLTFAIGLIAGGCDD